MLPIWVSSRKVITDSVHQHPNCHSGRLSFVPFFLFEWLLFLLGTGDKMSAKSNLCHHEVQKTVKEKHIKQIIAQINVKLQTATLVPSFKNIWDELILLLHDDSQNIWNLKSLILLKKKQLFPTFLSWCGLEFIIMNHSNKLTTLFICNDLNRIY